MVDYDQEAARRGSKYIDDRRGQGGRRARRSGGGGGMPVGKVGGIGGLILTLLVMFLGGNALTDGGGTSSGFDIGAAGFEETNQVNVGPAETGVDEDAETVELMAFLMEDIQTFWDTEFAKPEYDASLQYQYTSMVLFSGGVSTGCGNATSAVGPFYCPAPGDNRVYIDVDFFNELRTKFGAPGDFAQSYVIAHEIGHHLQSITGISGQVRQAQQQNPSAKNELSVRQELQADCFAGVWAADANSRTNLRGLPIIEQGDIEEGLGAAAAVGDDRIQTQAGMSVDPHTWTHGSAAARQTWFMRGFRSADPNECDTYSASSDDVGL